MRQVVAVLLGLALFLALYFLAGPLNLGPRSFIWAFAYGVLLLGLPILTFVYISGASKTTKLQAWLIFFSLLLGVLGLFPLGWLGLNQWALAHGYFIIAIPGIAVLAYLFLRSIVKQREGTSTR